MSDFPTSLDDLTDPLADDLLGPDGEVTFDGHVTGRYPLGSGIGIIGSPNEGVRVISFISPDGTTVTLPYSRSATGLWGPPIEIQEYPIAQQAGSFLRSPRHGKRTIAIPVFFQKIMIDEQLSNLRSLMYALDPTRGVGYLRIDNPDSTSYEIPVRLSNGWDIQEEYNRFLVGVFAFETDGEPYFQDLADITATYFTAEIDALFFPLLPLTLAGRFLDFNFPIRNDGQVHAWPRFTITGPGEDPLLENTTTGKQLSLDGLTILDGQTIYIDTRPGAKTVLDQDGNSLMEWVDPLSSLWPLEVGVNTIHLTMGGLGVDSSIAYAYKRQWLSA